MKKSKTHKKSRKTRTYKKRIYKNSLTTPIFFSKHIKNNVVHNNFPIGNPNNKGSGILVPGLRQFL